MENSYDVKELDIEEPLPPPPLVRSKNRPTSLQDGFLYLSSNQSKEKNPEGRKTKRQKGRQSGKELDFKRKTSGSISSKILQEIELPFFYQTFMIVQQNINILNTYKTTVIKLSYKKDQI